ncbi:beta-ketoacyl-ACP synthase II [Tuwongella immobilis]|uniref:3-oxoacyl-[acyl-carrier-protein] synthase 2 n=1 Tax=Tuwongella immobilis TaxID=692036 RepID=A0A6C2YHR5_9BACT|nr:beta-ketoacyl-ACP synthase II [Tuwongella immobilis]VIP00595.1 3-oxoacyl-acp synthase : 3-oxoacyl-[acyl-carrier-protein] synthase 2 OS=Planctomyces brasiliensis (strain ATCC 49424 / DSM 5305 / JCM 21570 / NBRC 103401 / IFAM 1448) GN=Plabr_2931 PE=3 SV=1: ketoacyl-synt: Ketoacyl-synt_C [Tuwongella immobilis]VTR96608.1 3-oxoacyl-acp synthase : 3-oxoacyl-[acyl-carrier-protein] synthase 2 OS=Planctomyces brasiliensis (strain ATCC 49424 / DSM 5305 / JCM 21570 / NBRC 103401 / IFAM 1448) GN=Plabr_293
MSKRRVVITGMGVITPLGHHVDALYQNLIAGKSGVGWINHFDASKFPTKIAAQVQNFDLSKYVPDAQKYEFSGVNTNFALAAAKQALADAGLLGQTNDDLVAGIYLGSGEGNHEFHQLVDCISRSCSPDGLQVDGAEFYNHGLKLFRPACEYELEMHTTAGHLAEAFDLQGPNFTCLTACAASSQAIGEAVAMIRYGDADLMLSGGAHSMIHPLGVTGFNLLTALSTNNADPTKASRPFDRNRDGFVLGEGSGMIVLEELEHAKKRGATIYAELTGYGTTADAYRVTDSHPEGRGAIACIANALADAGLTPQDIGYVNAHGTSTQVNDRVESVAIKKLFGDHAYKTPISSSKSMLGHLIAAAGVVELIISIMTIRNGVMPPTINYETPDPDCDLDYIPNTAREKRVDHVLSNSFGFGGQNISLVVSRFRD